MDAYPELETTIAKIEVEQEKDTMLTKVEKWISDGTAPNSNICFRGDEQKYLKQLPRLAIDDGILKRNYHDDGTIIYHLCVPKHVLKEIL